ncbi:hypothetical protein OH76DRAFT_253985 [Lentinus brumalis]|uniref:Uncharacterized protein n=1 Tax=Lentinus brumalis TaxID=2498619 RepID=A0A371CLE6_9APHY|nr:hypothetical protein OH76DRAFT_253985 [Polyporus brumalis]
MSPPCPSPTPPSSVANLPFKYRRKSFSEDNPDYYLVPPSPSLSPSRSLSLSSSPPSSPTTLATSPAGPSHLDTAAIHPPSSPTRPSAFHGYGYAYSYARVHDYDQHHYKLPHARPYAIVPPPAVSARSSVSAASPATSDGFRPVFPSRRTPHHDEDDDIEDYALGFDLDDLLAGSSPSRRISFNTSDERDKPFVRPPPKLKPLVASTSTSTASSPEPLHPRIDGRAVTRPRAAELRARDIQGESERTRASAPLVPLPPSATPICARSRTRTRSPAVSAPASPEHADADDVLPPSSPIASSPLSSPTRSSERESDSLPPSSPIPIPTPQTPPRQADEDVEMEMEMDELFASPPSPTLDALRITSRVALRALMNPAPDLVLPHAVECVPAAAAPERLRLPVVSAAAEEAVPVAEEDVPVVEEKMDVEVEVEDRIEGDGDVTPLVLGEAEEPVEEAEVDVVEIVEEEVQILGPAEEAVESIAEPITQVAVQIAEPMALPVSRVPSVCGQPAEEAVEMTEQVVEVQVRRALVLSLQSVLNLSSACRFPILPFVSLAPRWCRLPALPRPSFRVHIHLPRRVLALRPFRSSARTRLRSSLSLVHVRLLSSLSLGRIRRPSSGWRTSRHLRCPRPRRRLGMRTSSLARTTSCSLPRRSLDRAITAAVPCRPCACLRARRPASMTIARTSHALDSRTR